MLREQPFLNALLINILLGTVWHYATFFLCVFKNKKSFSPDLKMFRPHKWEKDGKFYADILKINKWKDCLPQHIGKDGFSKDHLDDISLDYIDEFIMETCRGEWNHTMNCIFFIVLLIINNFTMGFLLSICLLIGNLPFVFIQRYNRLRLQRLRKTLIRKIELQQRRITRTEKALDNSTELSGSDLYTK